MSKSISSIHHLTRILSPAVLVIGVLFFGLTLLMARPAYAQGPVVNIGDLPPGKVVTITFRAAITDPLPAGVTEVCNQGLVTGGNFSNTLTNDPTTVAANDPTCTPIDLPLLSVAPETTPSETGPTNGSFTLFLDEAAPAGGLIVNYDLAGSTAATPADYSLAAGSNIGSLTGLTFTINAGAIDATILIVPVDDQIDDNNEIVRLNLTDGSGYVVGTASATETITDNDTAGVTLSTSAVNVTEGGATDTYTVQLETIPTSPVTITFNTGTQLQAIPALVFPANATALNPQTVTVTATNDVVVEGDHSGSITHSASSADPNYTGGIFSPSATVAASITDNDIRYTLTTDQATVNEGDAGSVAASFTITRTGDITRSSSVDFTLGGTATDGVDYNNVQPSSGTVNFSAGQFSSTISLDVLGDLIDETDEDISVTLSGASGTGGGSGVITGSPASTTIIDDDSAGILVSPTTPITISEPSGSATFNIRLTSQPTATVTITLSPSTAECSLSAGVVNLTALNWDTGVTTTVTAEDDFVVDGSQPCDIVTSATSSSDPNYDGSLVADVDVTVTDDDVAGVTITSGGLDVTEGGATGSYNVRLNTVPTSVVTINFNTGSQLEAITSLTFPADLTALEPQTVTVTATDDTVVEGNHSGSISHSASSSDPNYDGAGVTFSPSDTVAASIIDNDISYTLAANQTDVNEGDAGSTAISFTVTRTGDITRSSAISFTLSGAATNGTDYNNVLPAGGTLSFSGGQTSLAITLNVLGDQIVEGNEAISLTVSGATGTNLNGTGVISGSATANTTILDDDTAGIVVDPKALTISEPAGSATFNLSLTSQPIATVTIGLSSGDLSECTVPSSAILTPANWSTGVTVTVTAVDDLITDGPQTCLVTTAAAASSDPNYNGVDPSDVVVTVNDDDVPGFLVTPTGGLTTTETGGTAAFTVRLRTEPAATVTLTLVSTDTSEGAVSPASLTFTGLNWNIPQTVTVTGQNDAIDDGNQPYTINTQPAVSSDPDYNTLNPANVQVVNLDDDTAGFIVSTLSGDTSESGLTATVRIRLASRPLANVTLPVTSSDLTEGTASPAFLTFTPLNWNVVQTVTLTGVDDPDPDGAVTYTLQLGPATSSDPAYQGLDPADLTLENEDNDGGTLYLPLIVKQLVTAPDLVIESLTATSGEITLVIRNQGPGQVADAFWVDVYFNPSAPPTVNQPWPNLAGQGAVWGVDGAGLSALVPGGTLTLTTGDAYYFPQYSTTPPLPVGANVFGLVDSVNPGVATGAVVESNEANNRFGPVISTAGAASSSASPQGQPATRGLPSRN